MKSENNSAGFDGGYKSAFVNSEVVAKGSFWTPGPEIGVGRLEMGV